MRSALKAAKYERLENGSYYGEIPGFQGLWANAATADDAKVELEKALEDWILFSVWHHLPVPIVDGIELIVKEAG